MKKALVAIFVTLAFTLVLLPAAWAGEGCKGGEMMAKLGLTPDQMKQAEKMKLEVMGKMLPLKVQMAVKRAEMKVLWMKEAPDRAALLAKAKEMDALREKMREIKFDMKLGMLKALTPEQKMKFMLHMGGGHGEGCGGGDDDGCTCGHGGKGGHGGCDCGCGGDCTCGHGGKGGHEGKGHDCGASCPMHGKPVKPVK
jgi:Spy/CpxP family protein refolding chaperone